MHPPTLFAVLAFLALPTQSFAALLPTICDYSILAAANCTSIELDLIETIDDEMPLPTSPPMPPGWGPLGAGRGNKTGEIGAVDIVESDESEIENLVRRVVSVPVERKPKERTKRWEFPIFKSIMAKGSSERRRSKDSTTGPIGNPLRDGTHGGGDELPIDNPGLPVQGESKPEVQASDEKGPDGLEKQAFLPPIDADEIEPNLKTITVTRTKAMNTVDLQKRDDFLTLLISGTFTFTTLIPKPTMTTLILFEMVNVPLLERMRQQQIAVRVTKAGDYLKPMVTVGPDNLFVEKIWPGLEQIVAPRDGEEDDSLKRPTIYGYYMGTAAGSGIGTVIRWWAVGLSVLVGAAVML